MDKNANWWLDREDIITMVFYVMVDTNWTGEDQVVLEEAAEEMDY